MLAISSLSVGCRNIVLLVSFEKLSEKCLCEYFMLFCSFSYRGKVRFSQRFSQCHKDWLWYMTVGAQGMGVPPPPNFLTIDVFYY